MRLLVRFAILGVALAVLTCGAMAGPNEHAGLFVQGNAAGVETNGDPCTAIALPATCWDLVPTATPDASDVEWFLIVAVHQPEQLSFNTITFGIGDYDYGAGVAYIAGYGPCFSNYGPLEIPSDGWPIGEPPGDASGTSVSWAPECLTGNIVPIYYFGFYAYGNPQTIQLGDFYPGQDPNFVSCGSPPEEDSVVAFGVMPLGGAAADPVDCELVPVMETTWGQIKNIYR
jgi:hypothetical protein